MEGGVQAVGGAEGAGLRAGGDIAGHAARGPGAEAVVVREVGGGGVLSVRPEGGSIWSRRCRGCGCATGSTSGCGRCGRRAVVGRRVCGAGCWGCTCTAGVVSCGCTTRWGVGNCTRMKRRPRPVGKKPRRVVRRRRVSPRKPWPGELRRRVLPSWKRSWLRRGDQGDPCPRAHRDLPMWPASGSPSASPVPMSRLPYRSTSPRKPGWITVVESISSTMAGPSTTSPAASR